MKLNKAFRNIYIRYIEHMDVKSKISFENSADQQYRQYHDISTMTYNDVNHVLARDKHKMWRSSIVLHVFFCKAWFVQVSVL